MIRYQAVAGPHGHSGASIPLMMWTVILALLPALIGSVVWFGIPALGTISYCLLFAIMAEWLGLTLQGKPLGPMLDGSALLTALLLAMSLPAQSPWWLCALGSVFAVAVGKQLYGGLGQNPFNPAMLARVMLLICFPLEMTQWTAPHPWLSGVLDGFSGATPLEAWPNSHIAMSGLLLGEQGGSLGETSALLLCIGGIGLVLRGVIHWRMPVAMLGTLALCAQISHWIQPDVYAPASFHLCSGGAMLAAWFIITDPVTSPSSPLGQWLFAAGCGLLVWLIRSFGLYPEGVAFAVLLMNTATPLFDHYIQPAVFGQQSRLGRFL